MIRGLSLSNRRNIDSAMHSVVCACGQPAESILPHPWTSAAGRTGGYKYCRRSMACHSALGPTSCTPRPLPLATRCRPAPTGGGRDGLAAGEVVAVSLSLRSCGIVEVAHGQSGGGRGGRIGRRMAMVRTRLSYLAEKRLGRAFE